jgi:hypothetical protein
VEGAINPFHQLFSFRKNFIRSNYMSKTLVLNNNSRFSNQKQLDSLLKRYVGKPQRINDSSVYQTTIMKDGKLYSSWTMDPRVFRQLVKERAERYKATTRQFDDTLKHNQRLVMMQLFEEDMLYIMGQDSRRVRGDKRFLPEQFETSARFTIFSSPTGVAVDETRYAARLYAFLANDPIMKVASNLEKMPQDINSLFGTGRILDP